MTLPHLLSRALRAHEVMVSNTRTPDTLFSVTGSIGCKAGTPAESPKRRAQPIAGNDAAAKEVVTRLLEEFGFDGVDAGVRPLPKLWFG
jgi:hypothetical protein